MESRNCSYVLGIPVDRKPLDLAISEAIQVIRVKDNKQEQVFFACANPHSIVVAQNDKQFREALNNASTVVADGAGVTLMGKLTGLCVGPRITGHDYFNGLMSALNSKGSGRVFFFGSTQKVLDLIHRRFARDYPALTFCGSISPPFGEWPEKDNERMIAEINQALPDVLWVGMTAPKQEKWIAANRYKLNVAVIGAVGAVFDFYAGTSPRAPELMCKLGIEWLYRLLKEPKRMWRRNFISTPAFIFLVMRQHVVLRQS